MVRSTTWARAIAARNGADFALELAGDDQPSRDADVAHAGNALEVRRLAVDPHLDVTLRRAEQRIDVREGDQPARRMMATRSQTRSTSDRTCDEKKIVRPCGAARRGSS